MKKYYTIIAQDDDEKNEIIGILKEAGGMEAFGGVDSSYYINFYIDDWNIQYLILNDMFNDDHTLISKEYFYSLFSKKPMYDIV